VTNSDDEINDFEAWCKSEWGGPTRSTRQIFDPKVPLISDYIDFDAASDNLKLYIGEKLILESTPRVGSVAASVDVQHYLRDVALEFEGDSEVFEGRRINPIKSALLLSVIGAPFPIDPNDVNHLILHGGASPAAQYLLSQLEYLFRIKSRYLDAGGTIVHSLPTQLRDKVDVRGTRVNQIDRAFEIYLYRNTTVLGRRLRELERKISVSGRLKLIRNPAMHGFLGDISVEGRFYGLILSMFYYAERST